jgi:O-antigen/teichoic acid export membrane protein
MLGVSGFGGYTYIISWISVLGMIGTLGLESLLVRHVSFYVTRLQWRELRGLLIWSIVAAGIGASSIALITLCNPAGLIVSAGNAPDLLPIAASIVFACPFFLLLQAVLRGLGKTRESQFIDYILLPAVMLCVVTAYAKNSLLTLSQALLAYLIAISVAAAFVLWENLRAFPKAALGATPGFENSRWLTSAGHLLVLGCLNVVSSKIDCILLGFLSGNEELGLYSAAVRGANLIALPLNMVVITIAPLVARFHTEGRLQDLIKQIHPQLRLAFLAGLSIAVGINFENHLFFGLFGNGFEGGSTALVILSIGQLLNVFAGPVACLLTMTGHERVAVMGIGLGTAVTCLSGLMLIAPFGSCGAAIASSLGLIAWNCFLVFSVRRTLGIWPIAFWRTEHRLTGET